jgi:amino-acid N-acetyltransferase
MKKNSTIASKVRNAAFTDVDAIFSLIKEHPDELLARPTSDIVQNIDRFLVCEKNDMLVGTVSWHILPEIGSSTQPTVEIKSLAVRNDYQGRGIGRALIEAVIERIKVYEPAQIIALTFTPEFFRKMGFREVPKATLMHKLYMGCINCSKYDSPFTCPEVAMAMAL